tara:strand:+ start:249 stop:470 length:222 start_codon:yes stop_codon:yes gene_type:complete
MVEKQTQTIYIDDVPYSESQLSDAAKICINHITDLDRKIKSAQTNIDQLSVGRNGFISMLKSALEDGELVATE